jgi:hypothetical protein
MRSVIAQRKARPLGQALGRPARIRLRLRDAGAPGAIPLALPARSMRAVSLFLAASFVIFAAIEWATIASMFGRSIDDVFDLVFLLFQGFWALGWLVGVLVLGALTILFAFYSESARLEDGRLVHIPKLGPLTILVDYDLSKITNVRLEQVSGNDRDTVRVRFDYDGGAHALGDAMPRADGQRVVDAIAAAARFVPRAVEARVADTPIQKPTVRAAQPAVPMPWTSAVALVVANLVPLAGVLFFGWDLASIMVLYWVESGVIAFYTAMKIAIVGKLAAIAAVPFFVGHFGGFMAAHFLLIYGLFLRGSTGGWTPGVGPELYAIFIPIWIPIAALFISHGVSFYTNFIGQREYEHMSVSGLMTAPYNRVMVMHLTLIFGGWIILLIGMPAGALVVLLLLKTAVDLRAHRNEHAAAAAPSGQG